ncbi:MAG: hypothetical protein ACLVEJ_08845 [Parabacteroides sp.]
MIHLGFGLYRHMLNPAYYSFARQCGATHIIVHLVDYFGNCNSGTTNLWEIPQVGEMFSQIGVYGV